MTEPRSTATKTVAKDSLGDRLAAGGKKQLLGCPYNHHRISGACVRHLTLGNHGEIDAVGPGFAVAKDMLVTGKIYGETHFMLAKTNIYAVPAWHWP